MQDAVGSACCIKDVSHAGADFEHEILDSHELGLDGHDLYQHPVYPREQPCADSIGNSSRSCHMTKPLQTGANLAEVDYVGRQRCACEALRLIWIMEEAVFQGQQALAMHFDLLHDCPLLPVPEGQHVPVRPTHHIFHQEALHVRGINQSCGNAT